MSSCTTTFIPSCTTSGGGGGDVAVEDEGIVIVSTADTLNFVGGLVEVTETPTGTAYIHIYIPEVTSDPASPAVGDAWVLKSGGGGSALAHSIVTLGLTLVTSGGGGATYEFRYKTTSDGIVGVALT